MLQGRGSAGAIMGGLAVPLASFAFLAFMSACLLAPVVFAFRGHGPDLLTMSKLALLCLAAEIVVAAFVGSAAIHISGVETAGSPHLQMHPARADRF
jgi:hypothetical protein